MMELDKLELLAVLHPSNGKGDWIKCLDSFFRELRKYFVFDNIVVYRMVEGSLEPEYARAIGRGRRKEAEASWGEQLASQVISSGKIISSMPPDVQEPDRTASPHLLGLPLMLPAGAGALVFVRFGGPNFGDEQTAWALLAACQVMRGSESHSRKDTLEQLDLARRHSQLQDDFIATISHELHTPLGFIKGYTTSLMRSDTSWDPATQKEFLTIIDEETDQLVMLIDRMMDSARLQSGMMPMDFQPVRLDVLLRDIVMKVQGRHAELPVHLDLAPASPILADMVRLSQVLNNLFDNAMKYAPGSAIDISLRPQQDHQVIHFQDHGPGIPAESLPFLFDRFFRVPNSSNRRGTGLGLFICSQIIQAHRGLISVQSIPGKGTTFQIELPVNRELDSARSENDNTNPGR